jgi:glycosyltransferase involved in cell wall biosynthesis
MLGSLKRLTQFHRDEKRVFRVLAILPCWIPSTVIGVVKPLRNLASKGLITFEALLESEEIPDETYEHNDVIIFSRNVEPFFRKHLEKAVRLGKNIIYELDDNFWDVPLDCEFGRYVTSSKVIRQLETYIAYADLVRVYSQPLYEKCVRFNRNVKIARPGMDFSILPDKIMRKDDKVQIVWATSRGNEDKSFGLVAEDLERVLTKYKGTVEMVYWGAYPLKFSAIHDVKLYDFVPDYDEFIRKFSEQGFDIGLAPLEDNVFTRCKTNNKFREYGACGVAGIYSNVPVYSSWVKNGVTGLLVDSRSGAWFEAIDRLLTDRGLRAKIQQEAYRYVFENHRQELAEGEWLKDLRRLLDRKRHRLRFPLKVSEDGLSGVRCVFEGETSGIGALLEISKGGGVVRSVAFDEYIREGKRTEITFRFEPIKNSLGRNLVAELTYDLSMGRTLKEPWEIGLIYCSNCGA